MPASAFLHFLLSRALQVHIGKAEHDRYQKYGQDNADAGHPALPAVKPGRNGNKVKIMLHLYSLPNP